jgi:hypothetical protein
VNNTLHVAGVVHDPVTMPDPCGRCGTRHAHRRRARPRRPYDAQGGLSLDGVPDRVPEDSSWCAKAEAEAPKRCRASVAQATARGCFR